MDKKKMEERIKEIVEESQKLKDEFDNIGEKIQIAQNRQRDIINAINTNNGRIQELNKWKDAIEDKKKK